MWRSCIKPPNKYLCKLWWFGTQLPNLIILQCLSNHWYYCTNITFRKVSRERSISTPSIISSLTNARDRTNSEESRFSRSQSPHTRTTGATTPTTSILDVQPWGNTHIVYSYVAAACIMWESKSTYRSYQVSVFHTEGVNASGSVHQ